MTTKPTFTATYAFVAGVRNHEFELHADGCRDLKHRSILATLDATGSAEALAAFQTERPEAKVFTQACCNPVRMRAAGRLRPVPSEGAGDGPAVSDEAAAAALAADPELARAVGRMAEEVIAKSKRQAKRERKARAKAEAAAA